MKLVNIIPQSMSGETHQDSGPSIAVNPGNANEIVISTLTPDPNGGPNAPVFVSTDGGTTWSLKTIIPNGGSGTAGATMAYGQSSNQLYTASLRSNASPTMDILRTTNPIAGASMTEMDSPQTGIEQPYIAVATVPHGPDAGKDRVYIGMNVPQTSPFPGPDVGKSSTIRQTMDAQAAAPVFTNISLDHRNKSVPAFQDLPPRNGPQVRPAVHSDGTVYAVFNSWKSWEDQGDGNGIVSADVVIVRDDNWGQSADPYGSLIDSGDAQAGQRIAINVPLQFYDEGGQERIGSGDLAIAVHPGNSSIVYVAWSEFPDEDNPGEVDINILHLRKSIDRGKTWSKVDLYTVFNGKNPTLAINASGQLGFLFQQLTGSGNNLRWETHLLFTANDIQWSDTLLATVPANSPVRQFFPYIGDYIEMVAVGNIFYGVFCAGNIPSLPNFPQGVSFQRNHNFATKNLLGPNNKTVVTGSIDPFFFSTAYIPPSAKLPSNSFVANVILIIFGIIQDGGGAYIDGAGHIHIIGPDPGPLWDYLVGLAQYRLATASTNRTGLEMQKLALQGIADLANAQIAQINAQLGQAGG